MRSPRRNLQKNYVVIVLLAVIVLLGAGLRMNRLAEVPAGFFADEASVGLNAYTILSQGHDQHGVRYPVFFKAFGEYKNPLAIYWAVPFIALFGLNEFAVRLSAAVLGVFGIVAIFFLVRRLFKMHPMHDCLALLAALFLAISPWHVHLSRIGWDSQVGFVLLTVLAVFVFLKALEKPKLLPVSMALFALSMYSYFPARAFIPLLGLGLFIFNIKFFRRHWVSSVVSFVVLVILLLPLALHVFSPEGMARWSEVSIFMHPPEGETIAHHVVYNYASHFSLSFLFLEGDTNYFKRHSLPDNGVLYPIQLPLIILGVFWLWQRKYRDVLTLLVLWLALYPVGSMFTVAKTAQATRSVIGVVLFQVLSAVGLFSLFVHVSKLRRVRRRLSVLVIIGVLIISVSLFSRAYFVDYPRKFYGYEGWQFGPKEVVEYFLSVDDQYDELFMTSDGFNGAEIFIPFYSQNYEKGCSNCVIGGLDKVADGKRQLFAVHPHEVESAGYTGRFEVKKTIVYPDGTTAFVIGEVRQ